MGIVAGNSELPTLVYAPHAALQGRHTLTSGASLTSDLPLSIVHAPRCSCCLYSSKTLQQ